MEPPMGHEYWLSEQERLEANNGVYNFFARKAGAYKNGIDSKEYTLISKVFDQYPLTEKLIDAKRNDEGTADALKVFDFKVINSLQDLLVRVVGLQEYFLFKKSGPINPSLKWNANTQSLPTAPSGPAPYTLIKLIQFFKHAYEEFKRTILEDVKLNKTTDIIKKTHDVIISAFNIQNYYLLLQGREPFWTNATYTKGIIVNHAAQYEFHDPNPPPPPPPMQPDLVTQRPIIPGVPNPNSVPNDVPRPPPMPPLPIPAQDLNYAPVLPVGGPPQLPAGGDPTPWGSHYVPGYDPSNPTATASNLPMYTVDPRMGYAGHSWYHPHPHPLRLIRPSRYWRY
jgi:hypothetical protein